MTQHISYHIIYYTVITIYVILLLLYMYTGLIPVWKAFIEDLFNANKIKVRYTN